MPFYDVKLEKNPSGGCSDVTLHNFEPQLAHNLPFCSEEGFFGKFYSSAFNLLIVPYHAEEFFSKKLVWAFAILGHAWTKTAHLPKKIHLHEKIHRFLLTYFFLWCLKKKSLEQILRSKQVYLVLGANQTETAHLTQRRPLEKFLSSDIYLPYPIILEFENNLWNGLWDIYVL